jgi:hypothetical protein
MRLLILTYIVSTPLLSNKMITINCIANSDWVCITDWVVQNLAWILLVASLIFFRSLLIAPFIAWKLLRNNRVSQGNGYGTLAADLFVNLWKSDKKCDETLTQCIAGAGQVLQRPMKTERVASEYLIPRKLAKIEDVSGERKVCVIKNFRNRAVRWFVIRGLIWKYDDDPSVYKI